MDFVPAVIAMNQFRLEGEYWTVEYEGSVVRLRDAKGLRYVAFLLRHPGKQFSARVLAAIAEGGEERAEPSGTDEDDEERARSAVSKRIKAALRRIHGHNPSLGRYLMATIRTGRACAYLPDPTSRQPFSA